MTVSLTASRSPAAQKRSGLIAGSLHLGARFQSLFGLLTLALTASVAAFSHALTEASDYVWWVRRFAAGLATAHSGAVLPALSHHRRGECE